jgi:hypothetical protein
MRRAPDPAVLMKDLRLVPPLYRTSPANARGNLIKTRWTPPPPSGASHGGPASRPPAFFRSLRELLAPHSDRRSNRPAVRVVRDEPHRRSGALVPSSPNSTKPSGPCTTRACRSAKGKDIAVLKGSAALRANTVRVPVSFPLPPANRPSFDPSTQTPILYGNPDQVSSHGSHIGCDGEAAWGAACCRREDRNSTRFRRIRRRGGSWNGRATLGVGLGVGVAVCSSERSQMHRMMGSILKSICKRSSIASIPRQEQVAGQIDAHTSIISISLQPLLFPRAGLLADPRAFRSSARITIFARSKDCCVGSNERGRTRESRHPRTRRRGQVR